MNNRSKLLSPFHSHSHRRHLSYTHTQAMSTFSRLFPSFGNKSSQSPRTNSHRAESSQARDMSCMARARSQSVVYISLEEARKNRAIALRPLKLLQHDASSTLDFAPFHSDLAWPSAHGLISLEEAQSDKVIARRAVFLL